MAAIAALRLRPIPLKPGGGSRIESPWLIQTRCVFGVSAKIGDASRMSKSEGPYSRSRTRSTRPPSWCAMSCIP
jgi:hypothetical protein